MGGAPADVVTWSDDVADAAHPDADTTVTVAHACARAYRRRANATNTGHAYGEPCAPGTAGATSTGIPSPREGPTAFLADKRDRGLAPRHARYPQ